MSFPIPMPRSGKPWKTSSGAKTKASTFTRELEKKESVDKQRNLSYYDGRTIKTITPSSTDAIPPVVTTVRKSKHEELPVYDAYRVYRIQNPATGSSRKYASYSVVRFDGTQSYYARSVLKDGPKRKRKVALEFRKGPEGESGVLVTPDTGDPVEIASMIQSTIDSPNGITGSETKLNPNQYWRSLRWSPNPMTWKISPRYKSDLAPCSSNFRGRYLLYDQHENLLVLDRGSENMGLRSEHRPSKILILKRDMDPKLLDQLVITAIGILGDWEINPEFDGYRRHAIRNLAIAFAVGLLLI